MVCSASVDTLHMGVPKMYVIDHKLFSGSSVCYKVGAISCTRGSTRRVEFPTSHVISRMRNRRTYVVGQRLTREPLTSSLAHARPNK